MPPIQKNVVLFTAIILCFILIYLIISNGLQKSSNLSKWLPNEIEELPTKSGNVTSFSHRKMGNVEKHGIENISSSEYYNFMKLAPPNGKNFVPIDVAVNVKQFLLLVGTPNWGMTFVQRLVNMHPNALICNGMSLKSLQRGIYAENESKKKLVDDILGLVYRINSHLFEKYSTENVKILSENLSVSMGQRG